jgi:transcriptional regulator with XRE-family HTH domain
MVVGVRRDVSELNLHGADGLPMKPDDSIPEMSLCARLRNERERRQIALSSISANTKISASLFEALERGDVSRWPAGILRLSFLRAYAGAIGLDPDAIAREFLAQFPDPLDKASASALPVATPAAPAVISAAPADSSGLRLKLADAPTPFVAGRLLSGMRQRLAAVACDGGIVAVVALCVFIVSDRFWLPLGVAMIGYYLGGILLLGNTPGVCLLAPGMSGKAHYNHPPDEVGRSDDQRAHSDWHIRVPAR